MLSSSTSPLAAGARLPLTFIVAGLVAGITGTAWLAASPGLLLLPHLHPHVVALAHLWLLGCLLTICAGAIYQLLPVLANVPFAGERAAWTHLALHGAGASTMIGGFVHGRMDIVALGGAGVTVGVVLLGWNLVATIRRAKRLDPVLVAFSCAAGWLGLTVLAGLFLATNRIGGWLAIDPLAGLRAHAHVGVIGFFLTLLQGATFKLVPMFTLGDMRDLRRVGWSLALTQTGLVLLAPGLLFHARLVVTAGALLLLFGYALAGRELFRALATRRKRVLEPGLRGFLLGLGLIAVSALGGLALLLAPLHLPAALGYGVLAVLGGVLATVQGMLCKIVPFLVWMRVYGPRVGRQPTPQAASLGWAAGERAWLWLHAASVVLLTAGTACEKVIPLTVGAWIFTGGEVALLASLATTLRHLRRPIVPQARTVGDRPLNLSRMGQSQTGPTH